MQFEILKRSSQVVIIRVIYIFLTNTYARYSGFIAVKETALLDSVLSECPPLTIFTTNVRNSRFRDLTAVSGYLPGVVWWKLTDLSNVVAAFVIRAMGQKTFTFSLNVILQCPSWSFKCMFSRNFPTTYQ
jgi:hypothetical protein